MGKKWQHFLKNVLESCWDLFKLTTDKYKTSDIYVYFNNCLGHVLIT